MNIVRLRLRDSIVFILAVLAAACAGPQPVTWSQINPPVAHVETLPPDALVAVNGVFTHASPADMGKRRHSAKHQKALRGAAPPALSGFQEHVVNAIQSRLEAAVAKAASA